VVAGGLVALVRCLSIAAFQWDAGTGVGQLVPRLALLGTDTLASVRVQLEGSVAFTLADAGTSIRVKDEATCWACAFLVAPA
jgi:hypothetical protein